MTHILKIGGRDVNRAKLLYRQVSLYQLTFLLSII
jgi:hypothetical protein